MGMVDQSTPSFFSSARQCAHLHPLEAGLGHAARIDVRIRGLLWPTGRLVASEPCALPRTAAR